MLSGRKEEGREAVKVRRDEMSYFTLGNEQAETNMGVTGAPMQLCSSPV